MKRPTSKIMLIAAGIIVLLVVAGNAAFVGRDDRLTAAFNFAVNEPEAALRQISEAAKNRGTLAGSGLGVTIPGKNSAGPTQWTVSPDGVVRGTAPDRGLTVLLTPKMQDKEVIWHCSVEPEREFLRGTCGLVVQFARSGR